MRKMEPRYIYKVGFLATLLWLVSACIAEREEIPDNGTQADGKEVPVNILSRLAVGDEEQVSKLRIIIFSTRSSDPYGPKTLTSNQTIGTDEDYTAITYVGYNDIYVIGNEPVDLSGVKTPEELKIQLKTETSLTAPEFVFYRQLLSVNVRSKDEIYLKDQTTPVSRLDIQLQRVIAKLTVKFDLDTEIYNESGPTGQYMEFETMELIRIPKYSCLIPDKYKAEEGFLDNLPFSLQDNSSTETHHFTWSSGEIYLPEYLLEDNSYRTFLRIKGASNGITRIYTLPVGDGMNPVDSHSKDWNITRNRHYSLTISGIRGYGEESLEVNAKVAGWSEISVPVDITGVHFLAINKKAVDVKSIRFFTYVRFASSNPIEVIYPGGINESQLTFTVEYDDATQKSGRLGVKQGNWNIAKNTTYVATIKSGAAFVNLDLNLFKAEVSESFSSTNWTTAMGYPSSANNILAGYYDAKLYHDATEKTGCRAYYPSNVSPDDPIRGQGCWRLPVINENWVYAELPSWCIDEPNASQAYVVKKEGYIFQETNKYMPYPYLCVLDTRPPELSEFIVSDEDITGITKDNATSVCTNMGAGWRLPTSSEMQYVFLYAGTNGLPNNFFSDSYWGKDGNAFIVATINDPDGSETTDAILAQSHTVRCVRSRY